MTITSSRIQMNTWYKWFTHTLSQNIHFFVQPFTFYYDTMIVLITRILTLVKLMKVFSIQWFYINQSPALSNKLMIEAENLIASITNFKYFLQRFCFLFFCIFLFCCLLCIRAVFHLQELRKKSFSVKASYAKQRLDPPQTHSDATTQQDLHGDTHTLLVH